jgi:hypothetical protein
MSEPGIAIPGETNDSAGNEESNQAPDFEAVAREKGWKPKDEFDGGDWVSAEEFVKRQPLFDKIKVQSKKLKELEKTVEALAKHYNTNITAAKEKAILDLKSERREAIELGEADRVDQIDQKIEHVQKMDAPVSQPVLATEIEQFVEEQASWFNKDPEMTQFAISYNESYLKTHPGDLAKSLEETLKKVKLAFPDKFENTRRNSPPPVDGGGETGGSEQKGTKYNTARLNPEQKIVYNQLVKVHKQMSHEAYFKSLEEAGYLET